MSEIQESYLSRLKFDPKLLSSWHAGYMQNVRVIILLILTIIAIGVTALFTLPRRLNPEVKLTIVSVATVLPGAGPGDVESLISVPLEDKLQGLSGLDTITSISRESFSLISMQFKSGVDKEQARTDAQTAVSEVTTLPQDAQNPKVTAFDFENQPIWIFALSTRSDIPSLMRFSQDLEKNIEDLPGIDRVDRGGVETQEIQVILDTSKIQTYDVNPLQLAGMIKATANSFPSGSVDTDSSTFALSVDSQTTSVDEIRNIRLHIGDSVVRLGDIARVFERSKPGGKKTYIASHETLPRRAVSFYVYKTSTADIDTTVKGVERYVEEAIRDAHGNFSIVNAQNAGEEIGKQLTDLVSEFQSTIMLVFLNLLLFLGIRQALIAGITIPLTFLLSFTWMLLLGQTINFITLFSLLLAFGTSIDDTIVTVSAMTSYYRTRKFTPLETALLVWRDFVIPIWTTTVTTVWAFLPLILSSGILGEFIKPIPIVVATTMYSSTVVAWFVTLPIMIVLMKPEIPTRIKRFAVILAVLAVLGFIGYALPKTVLYVPTMVLLALFLFVAGRVRSGLLQRAKTFVFRNTFWSGFFSILTRIVESGLINTSVLGEKYQRLITRILSSGRGRRIAFIAIITFALSSYLLIPMGLVKNEFFPKTNEDTLYVSLELPSGTSQDTLIREANDILEKLRDTKETQAVLEETGIQLGEGFGQEQQENSALFTVMLLPKEKRKQDSSRIASDLRWEFESFNKGKISVIELSGGPPAGADVQIKLLGEDLGVLHTYADRTIAYLSQKPGVVNTDKSVKPGTSKLVFTPDGARMAQNELSPDTVGFWLRLAASGFTMDSVKFGSDEEEDVNFYTNAGILHPEEIGSIPIPVKNGTVPLSSLGDITLKTNPTVIYREGGKRAISVTAGVLPGYSISDINKDLESFAKGDLALSSGYRWETGGVNEENTNSVNSIFRAMGLSFILIMATMVLEFSSFRQAAMILSLIPFAISGVFIMFGLTGTPLSFPALIGVLALFGIVVTNAMFIVEKINQNRKEGMDLIHAISDAGRSRLEPIMLTSLTGILGLVPITISNPLWQGLGGAIISGLMFSGMIMLIYIPLMYYTMYRDKRQEKK